MLAVTMAVTAKATIPEPLALQRVAVIISETLAPPSPDGNAASKDAAFLFARRPGNFFGFSLAESGGPPYHARPRWRQRRENKVAR